VAQAYTGTVVPCTDRVLTKAFNAYGDTNDYFLMTGGLFEQASDWFLTSFRQLPSDGAGRARILVVSSLPMADARLQFSGAPPIAVPGYTNARALALTSGIPQHISSRSVCLRPDEPSIRFFYFDPGQPGASLTVNVKQLQPVTTTSQQRTVLRSETVTIKSVGTEPAWRLSPIVRTRAHYSPTADLIVTFQASGAGWYVDNLAVDPFRSR
jgi:hypothetical protein